MRVGGCHMHGGSIGLPKNGNGGQTDGKDGMSNVGKTNIKNALLSSSSSTS